MFKRLSSLVRIMKSECRRDRIKPKYDLHQRSNHDKKNITLEIAEVPHK